MTRVLEFLPQKSLLQATFVSKAFRTYSYRCHRSELSLNHSHLDMAQLLEVLSKYRHFSGVRDLKLPNSVKLGKTEIQSLAEACPKIRNIDLRGVNVKPPDLLVLVEHFRNLSGIQVCIIKDGKGPFLNAMRKMGPRLRKLSAHLYHAGPRSRRYLEDGDLMGIADACPALESFEIFGISFSRNRYLPVLNSNGVVHHILLKCHNLKCLKLPGLDIGSLQEISQMPHNLTTFELDHAFENGHHHDIGKGGQGDVFFEAIQKQIVANKARA